MIKTVYLPLSLSLANPLMLDTEMALWRKDKQAKLDEQAIKAQDELNQLLVKGYVVIASHVHETNTYTHIVFVLYLSPDKVELPY